MRITDLLKSESILLGAQPADKNAAIKQLTDLMEKGGNLTDKEQYMKDVLAREASGTTGGWHCHSSCQECRRQGCRPGCYDRACWHGLRVHGRSALPPVLPDCRSGFCQ